MSWCGPWMFCLRATTIDQSSLRRSQARRPSSCSRVVLGVELLAVVLRARTAAPRARCRPSSVPPSAPGTSHLTLRAAGARRRATAASGCSRRATVSSGSTNGASARSWITPAIAGEPSQLPRTSSSTEKARRPGERVHAPRVPDLGAARRPRSHAVRSGSVTCSPSSSATSPGSQVRSPLATSPLRSRWPGGEKTLTAGTSRWSPGRGSCWRPTARPAVRSVTTHSGARRDLQAAEPQGRVVGKAGAW